MNHSSYGSRTDYYKKGTSGGDSANSVMHGAPNLGLSLVTYSTIESVPGQSVLDPSTSDDDSRLEEFAGDKRKKVAESVSSSTAHEQPEKRHCTHQVCQVYVCCAFFVSLFLPSSLPSLLPSNVCFLYLSPCLLIHTTTPPLSPCLLTLPTHLTFSLHAHVTSFIMPIHPSYQHPSFLTYFPCEVDIPWPRIISTQ